MVGAQGSEKCDNPKELVTVPKRASQIAFRFGGNPGYQ
jgi:hypothetical protein